MSAMEERGVLTTGDTIPYALGLTHGVQRGVPYVGHGGAFVGYRAATLRYPEENLSVMVLCHLGQTNPRGMGMDVGEILLEDRMDPPSREDPREPAPTPEGGAPEPTLSPRELEAYLGEYYSDEVGATLRIFRREEGLAVDVNGAWTLLLRPAGPDRFRAEYLTLRFDRADGRIVGFQAGSGRAGGVVFIRR